MHFVTNIVLAACLLAALMVQSEPVKPIPFGIIKFYNDKCQGKGIPASPIDLNCKNLPSTATYYVNGQQEDTGVNSIMYLPVLGRITTFSSVGCATGCNSHYSVLAKETCFRANGVSYKIVTPTYECQPKPKTKINKCNTKISNCGDFDVVMKWTGQGCRNRKGKLVGDGGCQCDGYCGYTCMKACKKDSQCTWNNQEKVCKTKVGNMVGKSIPQCIVQPV